MYQIASHQQSSSSPGELGEYNTTTSGNNDKDDKDRKKPTTSYAKKRTKTGCLTCRKR